MQQLFSARMQCWGDVFPGSPGRFSCFMWVLALQEEDMLRGDRLQFPGLQYSPYDFWIEEGEQHSCKGEGSLSFLVAQQATQSELLSPHLFDLLPVTPFHIILS